MSSKSQFSQIKDILYPELNKPKKNKFLIRNIKHVRKLQNLNKIRSTQRFNMEECNSYYYIITYLLFLLYSQKTKESLCEVIFKVIRYKDHN